MGRARADAVSVRRAGEAGFVGEHDGLDAVAQAELGEDAADVGPGGVLADDEFGRDLVVGYRKRSRTTRASTKPSAGLEPAIPSGPWKPRASHRDPRCPGSPMYARHLGLEGTRRTGGGDPRRAQPAGSQPLHAGRTGQAISLMSLNHASRQPTRLNLAVM
jgi:hypothetical protein